MTTLNGALDQLFNFNQKLFLRRGIEGNCVARRASSARAANSVHVVLRAVGQVIVDHARHTSNIQAACSHIGRHQNLKLTGLECIECFHAVCLGLVAMNRLSLHSVTFEQPRQPSCTDLGIGKHNHLVKPLGLDQMHHSGSLVLFGHRIGNLSHRVSRRVAFGHFDFDGRFLIGARQFSDFGTEGRRKQQGLALVGQCPDDAVQVRQKPHVQHAVSFVKHQNADLREVDRVLREVVK